MKISGFIIFNLIYLIYLLFLETRLNLQSLIGKCLALLWHEQMSELKVLWEFKLV
jgi:hypothetical protein